MRKNNDLSAREREQAKAAADVRKKRSPKRLNKGARKRRDRTGGLLDG